MYLSYRFFDSYKGEVEKLLIFLTFDINIKHNMRFS